MINIKNEPLFEGFSEKEIADLKKLIFKSDYIENQTIIKQGDLSTDLFLIDTGEVKVIENEDGSSAFVLSTMKEGEIFGEISFVDQQPRSATIIASKPTSAWVIARDLMTADRNRLPIFKKLLKNLMVITLGRLRQLNSQYAENLEGNLKQLNQQKQSGIYAIRVYCVISLILILEYVLNAVGLDVKGDFSSLLRILLVGLLTIYFYKKENISYEESGLTFKNWPSRLLEGTILGILIGFGAIGFFAVANEMSIKQVVSLYISKFEVSLWLLIYVFHSFIQEFIVRVGFQFSVSKFLDDHKGYLSIFITSLIFASMHTHWNWPFVTSVFLGNILFGFIYQKRRSIVEMTAVHYFSGLVVYFLGETK